MGQKARQSAAAKTGKESQSWVHWACGLQEHPNPPFSPENLQHKEEMYTKDITKWSSNDLMDKMENPEPEESQGNQPWGEGCGSLLSYPIPTQGWGPRGLKHPRGQSSLLATRHPLQ